MSSRESGQSSFGHISSHTNFSDVVFGEIVWYPDKLSRNLLNYDQKQNDTSHKAEN